MKYFRFFVSASDGTKQVYVSVLFGPFSQTNGLISTPTLITSIDGELFEGRSPILGDNAVDHYQITGTGHSVPFHTFPMPGDYAFETRYAMSGTDQIVFTDFCIDRQEIRREWVTSDGTQLYFFASMKGTAAVLGFFQHKAGYVDVGGRQEVSFHDRAGYWRNLPIKTLTQLYSDPLPFAGGTRSFYFYPFSSGQTIDPEFITRTISNLWNGGDLFLPAIIPQVDYVWQDLCQSCVDQARAVDVNSLSFMSELRDIASLVPKFSGWTNPKTYASAFLAFKYGITLTLKDLDALASGIARARATAIEGSKLHSAKYARRRTGGVFHGYGYTDEYHYKLITEPYPDDVMNLVRSLDSWGFYPTLTRDWDMVPFSFVLDWVINISQVLEQIDTGLLLQYYIILEVCRSRKVVIDLPISKLCPGLELVGNVTATHYVRTVGQQADPPLPHFTGQKEFTNYAELTALLIALSK
jgi:hypothetical protein